MERIVCVCVYFYKFVLDLEIRYHGCACAFGSV